MRNLPGQQRVNATKTGGHMRDGRDVGLTGGSA